MRCTLLLLLATTSAKRLLPKALTSPATSKKYFRQYRKWQKRTTNRAERLTRTSVEELSGLLFSRDPHTDDHSLAANVKAGLATAVAVAPEARRAGVATAVIARAERISRLWGFEEMWLHVNIDNPGARKLYEGLGYERVGEDPWWYLDRRYLMRKTIA